MMIKEDLRPRTELEQLIRDPLNLRLLIVAGTNLREVEINEIGKCKNLLKLDISSNGLTNIGDISQLKQLRLLYVHNNLLTDISNLSQIFQCNNLSYLTLFKNPISELTSLRHYVVNSLPSLLCLDFDYVLDEEKSSSFLSSNELSRKYFAKKQRLCWPLTVYPSDPSLNESVYLQILHQEIQQISNNHKKCSYITTIQRFAKGFITKKRFPMIKKKKVFLYPLAHKYAQKWKQFTAKKKDLVQVLVERKKLYLIQNQFSYKYQRALKVLGTYVREFLNKLHEKKRTEKAGRIMLRAMQGKHSFFFAFEEYFQLKFKSLPTKLLVRQDQMHLIQREEFLKIFGLFSSDSTEFQPIVAEFIKNISLHTQVQQDYQLFRVPDCVSMIMPTNPLQQLIQTSIASKIIRRDKKNKTLAQDKFKIFLWDENDVTKVKFHPFLRRYNKIVTVKDKDLVQKYKYSSKDREKTIKLEKRIQEFQEIQSKLLVEINFPHFKVLSLFLRTIIYNNQDVEIPEGESSSEIQPQKFDKIGVFFHEELKFVSAVMKIQQVWRMHRVIKQSQKQNQEVFSTLQKRHSAEQIQRWGRNLCFKHWQRFTHNLRYLLENYQDFKFLYIHEEVYLNLWRISRNNLNPPYLGANFDKTNNTQYTQTSDGKGKQHLFSFDGIQPNIYFDPQELKIYLKRSSYSSNKNLSVFPPFIRSQIYPDNQSENFRGGVIGDIYNLLNSNTKITRQQIGSMKYIKIDFSSHQEAKFRAAVLGKTYCFQLYLL